MTEHLGGPESDEKIAKRQARYERPDSKQFKIVDEATGEGMGWVGYWERDAEGAEVYEIGWAVIPAFQGRGVAAAATQQAIELARAEKKRRFLHAYPSVDNGPSNAICRRSASRSSVHRSSSTRRATSCSATTGGSTSSPRLRRPFSRHKDGTRL
jgi:GNAT superfamily N-acetyltransferase